MACPGCGTASFRRDTNTNNGWLAKGLMIVYVNGASEMYGCPDVVRVWEAAYATLVGTYHLAPGW